MTPHPQPGDRFRAKHWTVKVLEIRTVLVHAHDAVPGRPVRDSWLVIATDGSKWTVRDNPTDDGERWYGTPLREAGS